MKHTVVELRGGYGEGDFYFRVFTEDVNATNIEPRIQCWPGYAFVRLPKGEDPEMWKLKVAITVKASLIEKSRELEKDLDGLTKLVEKTCTSINS